MPDAQSSPVVPLPPGFLADYVAESSEHLITVRRALLALETTIGRTRPPPAATDELFHAFHSLKGLSGMVGFKDAEALAHEMESLLRRIQQSPEPLTNSAYTALVDATRSLEAIVGGAGTREATTDVGPLVERLAAPAASMRRHMRVSYVPTPELAQRGVTINTVRAALQTVGDIVQATPHIGSAGEVAFEFLLATSADASALDALEAQGLRWEEEAASGPDDEATPLRDESGVAAPAQFVRVDVARLDELMRVMGDLVTSRARLADSYGAIEPLIPPALARNVQEHTLLLERQLRHLRDGIMRIRMVPIGDVFERMTFVARDLAREQGKRVRLDVSGARTEVDKFVVERLADPLLHLVRNSVSHGLEPAEERRALGKPEEGTLHLRASTAGDVVVLDIEDDGRGIDAGHVAERARAAGLRVPEPLDNDAVLDLLCAPGFSTRDTVDRASGRGIGMAVVRRVVAEMGGVVMLETRVGHGTRFTIHLPITLAITDALIATVADRTFAVPQGSVREVLDVSAESIRRVEAGEVVAYRGTALPLVRLGQRFHLAPAERSTLHVFVVGSVEAPVGIAVDRVVGQREIVVRTLTDELVKVPGIAGATQLGDGQVALILDMAALARPQGSHA